MKQVNYYFDFLSPFSYLSWQQSRPMRENSEISLIYRPVMMTSLFSHFEIKAPGEIAPKREFMLKQCFRFAYKNNIEFIPPKEHPFNPLYALRLATSAVGEHKQEQIIDALWNLGWKLGQDLGDPDAIVEYLHKQDIPGQLLIDKSFEPAAKKELKDNIKMAKETGVFGVPSWTHNDELFWGVDSMDDLNNFLKGQDKWDLDAYNLAITKNPLS